MEYSLFPRDLFAELDRLQRQMQQAFELSPSIRGLARGAFPALNVAGTEDSAEIYAFAPGLDPASIHVQVASYPGWVLRASSIRPSSIRTSARTDLSEPSRTSEIAARFFSWTAAFRSIPFAAGSRPIEASACLIAGSPRMRTWAHKAAERTAGESSRERASRALSRSGVVAASRSAAASLTG